MCYSVSSLRVPYTYVNHTRFKFSVIILTLQSINNSIIFFIYIYIYISLSITPLSITSAYYVYYVIMYTLIHINYVYAKDIIAVVYLVHVVSRKTFLEPAQNGW